jgi:hypothetical protein
MKLKKKQKQKSETTHNFPDKKEYRLNFMNNLAGKRFVVFLLLKPPM